jgi:hypothetical protein
MRKDGAMQARRLSTSKALLTRGDAGASLVRRWREHLQSSAAVARAPAKQAASFSD